jgi:hypothetical protein
MSKSIEYKRPMFGKEFYCFKDKQQNLTKEKCISCEHSEQRNGYILCYYQENVFIYNEGKIETENWNV